MAQGVPPFKYEPQRQGGGTRALAGLPFYLESAHAHWEAVVWSTQHLDLVHPFMLDGF